MVLQRNLVILVNERDEWMGTADKLSVHQSGALHRALSIFITNSKGELLLQRRAAGKYHSGGLWSNACCSHPTPGEPTMSAASRRLKEELGIDTVLTLSTRLRYKADVSDGLKEHEFDHVFTGRWDGPVRPHAEEVSEVRWIDYEALDSWMQEEPAAFTSWFPILLMAWRDATMVQVLVHS
jgi:isopentenyl-diphosphate delta-isomerase